MSAGLQWLCSFCRTGNNTVTLPCAGCGSISFERFPVRVFDVQPVQVIETRDERKLRQFDITPPKKEQS